MACIQTTCGLLGGVKIMQNYDRPVFSKVILRISRHDPTGCEDNFRRNRAGNFFGYFLIYLRRFPSRTRLHGSPEEFVPVAAGRHHISV